MLKKFILSTIIGALTFVCSFFGVFNGFDYMATDALYQRPGVVDNNIKIIAIDEKSMDRLGPYGTWDRGLYADLLDTLYADSEYAPKLVVFDIIFQGNTDGKSDLALAEAAKNAKGVVAAGNLVFKDAIEEDVEGNKYLNRLNVEMAEYPYKELRDNSQVGFANSIQDSRDSAVRMFIPTLAVDGEVMPSLALQAARTLSEKGEMSINIPDTEPGEGLILKYTGKPGDYEAFSFIDILDGKIPKEVLRDSVIFVGAYAPGMMDSFTVPTGGGEQMYGVEIHANILEAIGNGGYMMPANTLLISIIYALIAFAFAFLAQSIPLIFMVIVGLALIIAELITGVILSGNHIFMPLITLPIAIIITGLGALGLRYFYSLMQRRKVLKAFSQYVAPQIVEEISKKGDFKLELGGKKRDIAVLFVDIRGFTPLSESLEPEQVVEILNEYLSLTTKAIFDNLGTLDKFVGDATMAVFNSPFDLDDYVYRAVCAARDIVAGSEDIRKKAFELTGKEVGFGVGVNCGEAIVGNIGCEFRMDYTAIGDTVNTAARLEANAKAGQVLLSQSVVDALGDRIDVSPVGEIPLKGKSVPIMVYELVLE